MAFAGRLGLNLGAERRSEREKNEQELENCMLTPCGLRIPKLTDNSGRTVPEWNSLPSHIPERQNSSPASKPDFILLRVKGKQ